MDLSETCKDSQQNYKNTLVKLSFMWSKTLICSSTCVGMSKPKKKVCKQDQNGNNKLSKL